MSHKKFGPDRFSRFDVYWIQTNRQTDRQTNKQTDKPNLYIDIESTVYTIYILSLSYPLELLPPAPHISARLFTSFHITFSRCTVYTVHAHIDPPFSLYNLRPLPVFPSYLKMSLLSVHMPYIPSSLYLSSLSFLSKHVPLLFLSLLHAPLSLIHLMTFCTCRPPLPLPPPCTV